MVWIMMVTVLLIGVLILVVTAHWMTMKLMGEVELEAVQRVAEGAVVVVEEEEVAEAQEAVLFLQE
jgi:uncharacterized protein YpmB